MQCIAIATFFWLLLLLSCLCSLSSALDGLRHNADSYTDQHYYSHVIHEWSGIDGRVRLARFRAVPADGRRETGRLTDDEHKHAWDYLSVITMITASFLFYHYHHHHHHTSIYSAPITILDISALQSHPNCQQTQNAKLKKCVLSRFLKRPGSVTARRPKSFGSEFHADGPAYVKARSPNLVRNRGKEKSDDDEDRRPRHITAYHRH